MKKNYIYIAFLAITLFGFSSCSDFLDRMPDDELSDGSFWKTPNDAKMFIADVYRQVLPGGGAGDIDSDINSDNAVHGIKWAAGDVSRVSTIPQLWDGAAIIKPSVPVTSCCPR